MWRGQWDDAVSIIVSPSHTVQTPPPPHLPHLPTRQPSCYFYTSISLQFMDEKSALPANLTILTILTIRLIPAKFCTASYCPGPLPFLVPCLFQVQFIALLYLYEVS